MSYEYSEVMWPILLFPFLKILRYFNQLKFT